MGHRHPVGGHRHAKGAQTPTFEGHRHLVKGHRHPVRGSRTSSEGSQTSSSAVTQTPFRGHTSPVRGSHAGPGEHTHPAMGTQTPRPGLTHTQGGPVVPPVAAPDGEARAPPTVGLRAAAVPALPFVAAALGSRRFPLGLLSLLSPRLFVLHILEIYSFNNLFT